MRFWKLKYTKNILKIFLSLYQKYFIRIDTERILTRYRAGKYRGTFSIRVFGLLGIGRDNLPTNRPIQQSCRLQLQLRPDEMKA